MRNIQLAVAGTRYGGWKKININRGIEQIAGSFEVTVTERWPDQIAQRKIKHGEEVTVYIDDAPVITGYVDDVLPSYDSGNHELVIAGRDKTADLVDCSAEHKTGQWINRTLKQIADDLCKPYGITVIDLVGDAKKFKLYKINDGESVFEALSRAARIRGVLLISDGLGHLVITRAGTGRVLAPLIKGHNILSASATLSDRDRYQTYVVKGQHQGFDDTSPADNSARKFTITDKQVGRYRNLTLLAEDQADTDDCKKRGTHERNLRAGRAERAQVTINDWQHETGLWQPNEIVTLHDDWLGVNGNLLIVSVAFKLDEGGELTTLEVARKEAFGVIELKDPETDSAW